MNTDDTNDGFEDRLRQTLRVRAADVTPDPATWRRVEARVRGRRPFLWAATAGATVAVVALAVVVGPGLVDPGGDVQFAPPASNSPTPAPSTRVEASAAPSAVPSPIPPDPSDAVHSYTDLVDGEPTTVLAAGPGIVGADDNGNPVSVLHTDARARECTGADSSGGCEAEFVDRVRVRPGSTPHDLVVAYREAFDCSGDLGFLTSDGADTTAATMGLDSSTCPSAPIWSPDGAFLAWLEQSPDGGLYFSSVAWDADAGAPFDGIVSSPVSGAVEGLGDARLQDWVWREGPAGSAVGSVVLTAYDAEGDTGSYLLEVERTAERSVALVPGAQVLEPIAVDGRPVLGYAAAHLEDFAPDGVEYLLTGLDLPLHSPKPQQVTLVRGGDGGTYPDLDLPGVVDERDPTGARVWIAARGDTVLVGDGFGQAWRVEWLDDGWSDVEELPGDVRGGDVIGPVGAVPATDGTVATGEPSAEEAPELITAELYFHPEGSGAEGCGTVVGYPRDVPTEAPLRGALEALFAGPTGEEEQAGAISEFSEETAGLLRDVRIDPDGTAVIDLIDFRERELLPAVGTTCGTGSFLSQVEATARQFESVRDVRYTVEGDEAAFAELTGEEVREAAKPWPLEVEETRAALLAAAEARSYEQLAALLPADGEFNSNFGGVDDHIAYYRTEDANGVDVLGTLAGLLREEPAHTDAADGGLWVWPAAYATDGEYLGYRVGIADDGTWRFLIAGD